MLQKARHWLKAHYNFERKIACLPLPFLQVYYLDLCRFSFSTETPISKFLSLDGQLSLLQSHEASLIHEASSRLTRNLFCIIVYISIFRIQENEHVSGDQ